MCLPLQKVVPLGQAIGRMFQPWDISSEDVKTSALKVQVAEVQELLELLEPQEPGHLQEATVVDKSPAEQKVGP